MVSLKDNNDKKSNVIRGFMGLSVTILGMLFAALWFTIQDQDQKAIMQMMIAINKSDAEQTLKVGQLRLEIRTLYKIFAFQGHFFAPSYFRIIFIVCHI
jgi:hypothetical protein